MGDEVRKTELMRGILVGSLFGMEFVLLPMIIVSGSTELYIAASIASLGIVLGLAKEVAVRIKPH